MIPVLANIVAEFDASPESDHPTIMARHPE